MILCLLMGLISGTVYYASLAYSAAALALFLFRTLHLRVEPEVYICYSLICRLFKIKRRLYFWNPPFDPGARGGKSWKEEALASVCSGRLLISLWARTYHLLCFRLAAHRDVVADILFGAGQVTFDQESFAQYWYWCHSSQERDWTTWPSNVKCDYNLQRKCRCCNIF